MLTLECDPNALVDLLPWKISKTLAHLVIRARGLRGKHVELLSREVLGKLLQHVHRMIVWMTLSSHQHMQRRIQVPKFLRREVVGKKGSVKMTVSKVQGEKKVS
jgi:hypothetical protein